MCSSDLALIDALWHRLREVEKRVSGDSAKQVGLLLSAARKAVESFALEFETVAQLRKQAKKAFTKFTHADNVAFDGMSRVAHVTDATDWRIEYPFVVLKPDTENEIPNLVRTCIELGLTIVPRGGGTGYTGGAIPMVAMSAIINTEKLIDLGEVENQILPGLTISAPIISSGAGVVTRRVADAAEKYEIGRAHV